MNELIKTNLSLLKASLLDVELLASYKFFYDDLNDFENQDIQELYRELDGDVYLELSNRKIIVFTADTENFSVKFDFVDEKREDSINLTLTPFWENKIANKILDVELLFSKYRNNPYGLKIKLEQDQEFSLIYESDTDFTSDGLIIR
jgi:hypothetical protein